MTNYLRVVILENIKHFNRNLSAFHTSHGHTGIGEINKQCDFLFSCLLGSQFADRLPNA